MSEPTITNDQLFLILRKMGVLAAPLFVALAAWAIVISPFLDYRQSLFDRTENARRLVERYQSVVARQDAIKADLERLKAGAAGEDLIYNAPSPNAAAALLQQKASEIITRFGGQMRQARVELKPKTANHQPFAVNVTFAISSRGLAQTLFQLEALRPVVIVQTLSVHGGPALLRAKDAAAEKETLNAEEAVLEVTLTVSALTLPAR